MQSIRNGLATLMVGIMAAWPCHAETGSAAMGVSALVPSGVYVNLAPITFNMSDSGSGSVSTEFSLEFDALVEAPTITFGSGGNNSAERRRMSDGKGNFIFYSLMQSGVSLTQGAELTMTQTSPRTYSAFIDAMVDTTSGVLPGTYSDSITVTIAYSQ